MQKKWGKPKERMPFPVSLSSRPSSFRAQREIFLAQRSNGKRQMRSSRSTHAILSLPHKYRVPLRHKRSLGSARDDDTRERAISHSLSFLHAEGCPFWADLSSAVGAPLLQGATPLACKSATPKRYSLPDGKVNELRIPLPPYCHLERSEKSFSFAARQRMWGSGKRETSCSLRIGRTVFHAN